ncbi:hypothetical protein FSP39_004260 [Pinctada imbricata]|uniref:Mitoferrin-1 n=1 Tax=Pinctada imbricata TaxID=66713 RepID=A0AA88Y2C9_PINIB|nr:hypothetical protein FSP39_004260 [Pinctada imbricata]
MVSVQGRMCDIPFEEERDPYESLPPSSTSATHALAGAAAGILEHSVMYPVDCVKTRMQSLVPDPKADYRSVYDAFCKIVKYEGLMTTARGINAVVGGAGPAHALYFACYEHIKKTLSKGQTGNHFAHATAGCAATLVHDAFMNPADVIKQRMQMYNSPYKSCYHCAKTVYRSEGYRAFYRSYTTQLTMNIPFQVVHFMTYEWIQDHLNPDRQYSPLSHVISGGVAGSTAAAVTMPLDVCKTLLNTQENCARTHISYIEGMVSACRTIYEFQGAWGFFRGLQARVIFQFPATAISWSVYEFCKFFLTKRQTESKQISSVNTLSVSASAPERAR